MSYLILIKEELGFMDNNEYMKNIKSIEYGIKDECEYIIISYPNNEKIKINYMEKLVKKSLIGNLFIDYMKNNRYYIFNYNKDKCYFIDQYLKKYNLNNDLLLICKYIEEKININHFKIVKNILSSNLQ
jgi:hypothetical protein